MGAASASRIAPECSRQLWTRIFIVVPARLVIKHVINVFFLAVSLLARASSGKLLHFVSTSPAALTTKASTNHSKPWTSVSGDLELTKIKQASNLVATQELLSCGAPANKITDISESVSWVDPRVIGRAVLP